MDKCTVNVSPLLFLQVSMLLTLFWTTGKFIECMQKYWPWIESSDRTSESLFLPLFLLPLLPISSLRFSFLSLAALLLLLSPSPRSSDGNLDWQNWLHLTMHMTRSEIIGLEKNEFTFTSYSLLLCSSLPSFAFLWNVLIFGLFLLFFSLTVDIREGYLHHCLAFPSLYSQVFWKASLAIATVKLERLYEEQWHVKKLKVHSLTLVATRSFLEIFLLIYKQKSTVLCT